MPGFTASDGVELYYEAAGQGPPIVFLHGWMMSHALFRRQLEGLQGRRRVVALDLRGCGASRHKPGSLTLSRLARDVAELLEHLELEKATLVGWSLGGGISMRFLDEQGAARVDRVCLIDFPPRLEEAPEVADKVCHNLYKRRETFTRDFLARMFFQAPAEADLDWMVRESLRCESATACEMYRQLRETALPAARRPYDLPALLVFPEHGWFPGARDQWKTLFPDHAAPAFAASKHCPFWEEAASFNAALLEFSQA